MPGDYIVKERLALYALVGAIALVCGLIFSRNFVIALFGALTILVIVDLISQSETITRPPSLAWRRTLHIAEAIIGILFSTLAFIAGYACLMSLKYASFPKWVPKDMQSDIRESVTMAAVAMIIVAVYYFLRKVIFWRFPGELDD